MSDCIVARPPVVITEFAVLPPATWQEFTILPPVTMQAMTGGNSALWTGEGPPSTIVGSHPGDEYLDTFSGTLYELT